jgi:tryptophanyl-tRNA synthetase
MRVLSGIKPTGKLTLGNYIGALKNFPNFQNEGETFIFIADLHALTMPIDPEFLRENSKIIASFYLAAGLDPKKCTIFRQSRVSEHSELAVILQNYLYMGELSRMTQFKEKSQNMNQNAIGLGLFAYPVLMAADILLYDSDVVPVGEDQTQHVELARDLVKRFNNHYGEILKMPEAKIGKVGKRIMSLSDPSKKMSKSDPKGDIFLLDDMKTIRKKIMSAVTDSGSEVIYDIENKPGIANLLTIYAAIKNITVEEAETTFAGYRYGDFKKAIADAVIEEIEPFQNRFYTFYNDPQTEKILEEGEAKASVIARVVLQRVQQAVGLR